MPNPLLQLVSVVALLAASPAAGQSMPALDDALIADFEPGRAQTVIARNTAAQVVSGDAAGGEAFLRMEPTTALAGRAYLRLPLPAGADFARHEQLTAQLRAPQAAAPVELRWIALDEQGRPIFQRAFALEPGTAWVKRDEPLRAWRWDDRRVGDWDEVRELVVRIDSAGVTRIELDEIRLEQPARPQARMDWLLDLAFGADPPRKVASGEGLVVATDAVDGFSEADLRRLLEDLSRSRAFLRRVFGDAIRPTDDLGLPASLLIFADETRRREFLERLGRQWHAQIAPFSAQGFTVQDIATVTYQPELGVRRPVYLHESVHTMVARDLRLLTGHAPHSPLQEGLANYLQLCVHPRSIDRGAYARAFAGPIDETGKGFFKPLEQLFQMRATTAHYAQLASVVAYLVEHDPPLLRALAAGLADGQNATDILARHGTHWNELQDRWLTWGRQHFAPGAAEDGAIFPRPREFQ